MATVYRGRHATLDRDVAIKVLHPHLSSSLHNRKRFAREAKAIEHLRHANILEIFDYSGIEASDCYIVTEFVHGETLTHLLQRRGRVVSEVTAIIGIALCRALAYAHAEGVLHRDIKTDNVMLRVDGTVKLMDFGIARFLDESQVTMTGALVGSPAFMSPEQAREEDLDHRSDLFALGAVLYYLVSGQLPFSGSNPSLILKNVIEGNRPAVSEMVPTMSASLAETIERLLATDPSDRFVSATAVEQELVACLAEVKIDPTDAEWSLVRFVGDPDGYEARLDAHLRGVLLAEGRRRLDAGDHLGALRLFNRLLSMDEHNPDVLQLIQSLHGGERATTNRTRWLAGGALGVLALTGLALGLAARREASGTAADDPAPPAVSVLSIPSGPDPIPPPAPQLIVASAERSSPTPARRDSAVSEPPQPTLRARPASIATGDAALATVSINAGNAYVHVWKDGRKIGESRQEMQLAPGVHDLVLKSPLELFEEKTIEITVVAGEHKKETVEMRPKPAVLVFKNAPADCIAAIGQDRRRVGDIDYRWVLERPDIHESVLDVTLTCGEGMPQEKRWNPGLALTQEFVYSPEP